MRVRKICHPKWRKKYCDEDKLCHRFFSDGTYNRDRELAELLHKPVSKLTENDKYKKADKFSGEGYKACRKLRVIVEEV